MALAIGTLAALAAALVAYLALAPGDRRLSATAGLAGCSVLSIAAVVACAQWLGRAESVYFVIMVLMIAWSALPFLRAVAGCNRNAE